MSKRYDLKLDRLEKATALTEHDYVPMAAATIYFPAKLAGLSSEEVFYDNEKYSLAAEKFAQDYDWDAASFLRSFESIPLGLGLAAVNPELAVQTAVLSVLGGGFAHDILKDCYSHQPGRELDAQNESQFTIRKPLLTDSEFAAFVDDPINFIAEVLTPRIYEALAHPGSAQATAALLATGKQVEITLNHVVNFSARMRTVDCPPWYMGLAPNPLDLVGAFFRDFDNFMVDMLERPEAVLKLCEQLAPVLLYVGKTTGELSYQLTGSRRVFMPCWYNGFLGPQQFRRFHWPFYRYIAEGLIEAGFTPLLSLQGSYDVHLETLRELPAGKFIAWFDKTDPNLVRQELGADICIAAGISPASLIFAQPAEVRLAVQMLLTTMKKYPGFILTLPFNAIGPARPENVWAMTEAARVYGVY
ncbi:MAG: hypothetical protein FWC59_00975 [Actinomycetia bacterium]|nr:hypothetical protein [Actinomycetes bacterium]